MALAGSPRGLSRGTHRRLVMATSMNAALIAASESKKSSCETKSLTLANAKAG